VSDTTAPAHIEENADMGSPALSHFNAGLAALIAQDWQTAEPNFKQAVNLAPSFSDAYFFWGVLAYFFNNAEAAQKLFIRAHQTNEFSDEFFGYLGTVVQSLGPERGDTLHRFLQKNRILPRQYVGRLGAEDDWNNVEPWHFSRRTINRFPTGPNVFDDEQKIVEKYILPGWLPDAPLFDKDSNILTMGSCFAQELRNYLNENGMKSDWMFVPPGLNNTFALQTFVDWCITGNDAHEPYWYDEHEDGGAVKWRPEEEKETYREIFGRIDGLILTVGLAEVWYDITTGGVFWRGVPKSMFDDEKHRCRISTVEENEANLRSLIETVRALRPGLPIILTLSPIPLSATFQDRSCFTSDCLSKSILRVAIDNVVAGEFDNLYYWPSFEIVRWLGGHLSTSMFGEDGNTRHVNRSAVRLILDRFVTHYFL
jgi:hypothetical protein